MKINSTILAAALGLASFQMANAATTFVVSHGFHRSSAQRCVLRP